MSLFRRRRPEAPEWAGFLDADEWDTFAGLVRTEAERRGWSHDLEWGTEDELFDLAVEHARAEPGLELQRHELPAPEGPPTPVWALVGTPSSRPRTSSGRTSSTRRPPGRGPQPPRVAG